MSNRNQFAKEVFEVVERNFIDSEIISQKDKSMEERVYALEQELRKLDRFLINSNIINDENYVVVSKSNITRHFGAAEDEVRANHAAGSGNGKGKGK